MHDVALMAARKQPYDGTSTLLGPLQLGDAVEYRQVLSGRQRAGLALWLLALLGTGGALVAWMVASGAVLLASDDDGWLTWVSLVGLLAMVAVELVRVAQGMALWLFARRAEDPVPLVPPPGLRVAMLTTMVPGKEPLDLIVRTLEAMRAVEYDGQVDVWLLDEGDDPAARDACAALGVHHFSRKGIERYNQPAGEFKARTKAGNHNAWRDMHEADYDVVAQMDPDHVPTPDFLDRSLGYFVDPDLAFVVAPQVYGNLRENWIAKGSAVQAYVFHGVIQRGGNGMRAPLLIGTNHLYRPSAMKVVGGYQDSIIEDHLTSMAFFSTRNPATGNYFKGVYTPDILAVGEGPSTFTDYFAQQKRWAYGIWEIMARHSRRMFGGMHRPQRLSFALLQMFYPTVALSWVLSNATTALFVGTGSALSLPVGPWAALWSGSAAATLGLFLWLRRFNLVDHERKELGLAGLGLFMVCIPVYVAAAARFLSRRSLAYRVTAKGALSSVDDLRSFAPHLWWMAAAFLLLLPQALFGARTPTLVLWPIVTAVVCAVPLVLHLLDVRRAHYTGSASPADAPASRTVLTPAAVLVPSRGMSPSAVVPGQRAATEAALGLRAVPEPSAV